MSSVHCDSTSLGCQQNFKLQDFSISPKRFLNPSTVFKSFFDIATHPKHWLFLRHLCLSWDRRVSSCALGRFQMQKNLLKDFHTFSMLSISLILYFSCLTFSVCSVSKPLLINFQVQIRIESCRLQMKTQNQTNRRSEQSWFLTKNEDAGKSSWGEFLHWQQTLGRI